jgi:DNA replication licensing factor MCM3
MSALLIFQTKSEYNYRESIKRMLDIEQVRLIVNLDHLRDYDRSYADGYVSGHEGPC